MGPRQIHRVDRNAQRLQHHGLSHREATGNRHDLLGAHRQPLRHATMKRRRAQELHVRAQVHVAALAWQRTVEFLHTHIG
ncbi:hypothetical protein BE20_25925 [Sorangium cellulosum]|nr:hypothetical protein BE20_25925 [Sorangium cellulosum]